MNPTPSDAPEPRFFSFEEANRTLPLVRRIVEDITDLYREMEPVLARYRSLPADQKSGEPGRALEAQAGARAEEVDALVHELHELGCHFKGFQDGLVDWYSYYAGRPVFLCWKLGEPEIAYWHQVDAGFAGRQPILPSQRSAFRSTRGRDGSG
ncbi:MAG: DUF2203 family protein [Gemmatimonadetes bacterium]|nr:DUF2203 domain-containing protein [Gemmatimonadota bacterium]NIQ59267.1 DUF2203 domain-containing protein [Gemmatimonadota bacterium]NIU79450.1 DUF2203 family protein [Gammaproteobacteria bacterium]NIX48103.1 DUF2203 family protein [Gemmatimonadota bacterium]NIY12486.1 DUF2203 family protein [Gemmatimonadota bacterium]